ncbi:MAG: hypothetical protein JFAIHJKO_01811 [Pyrinomonadaceae bacterium]|nr:hypothetical protein [Pyrinomonadaceae bacterium]
MFNLVRAELRRIFYNRSNLIFSAITILCVLLFLVFRFIAIFGSDRAQAVKAYQDDFAFPASLLSSLSISHTIALILLPTITAFVVGSDYHLDTWKMILPRSPLRLRLLAGKLIALMVFVCYLFLFVVAILHICTLFGAYWLNTPMSFTEFLGDPENLRESLRRMLSTFAFIFWYSSVATFLTILSRSLLIGASCPLFVYFLCNLIRAYSPGYVSVVLAPTHFGNLLPRAENIVPIVDATRPDVWFGVSWLIVLTHLLGIFLVCHIILKRQEFASR